MKNSESQSTPENWEDGTGGYFSHHLNGALHENLTSFGFLHPGLSPMVLLLVFIVCNVSQSSGDRGWWISEFIASLV